MTVGLPHPTKAMQSPKSQRRKTDLLGEHRAEIIAEAKELGLSGATDFQAAQTLGVDVVTIHRWKVRDPEFAAALRVGKDIADGLIEATLYHKARGYSFRSEKIFNNDGVITRAETVEHVPPDTTAMIFWLKNRQREKWRDVQDHKVQGEIEHKVSITDDPRRLAIAMLATLRKAAETEGPVLIEGETVESDD